MMQSALSKGLILQQPDLTEDIATLKVFADPKHLQQILINLLSNAVKYTPRGGKVWMRAEIHVDKLKVSVHDTGVGIPPHKQATLFERFERGDDTYSKTQEGTGIGLNLTKRLIELNGGRIGAESVQGEGSQFWIMVPLASGESQAALALNDESSAHPVELSGLTTVVVDDNPDACAVLQQILTHAGAAVRIANSVKDGLNLIAESPPDIILTDLAMPRESGLVLIERIRAAGTDLAGTPILVLSACAFSSDRDAAVKAGASGFVAKPFQPREVLKSVRELTFARAMGGPTSF
jgi:CheY-like chemotaxis protein